MKKLRLILLVLSSFLLVLPACAPVEPQEELPEEPPEAPPEELPEDPPEAPPEELPEDHPEEPSKELPVYTRNTIARFGDFDFELWSQNIDDVSMTLTGGGTFECEWTNAYNVLFRMGRKLGSINTYREYGEIFFDYAAEHNIIRGDVSYLCVYGWTEDPLIEFYVIENHGRYKPPGGIGFVDRIEVDGCLYDVYEATRTEQPSIQGIRTFQQYFSVNRSRRTEGTISLHEHFKAWEELGLDMSGKMYEVALCVEGYRSSGNANVYRNIMTIGDVVYGN